MATRSLDRPISIRDFTFQVIGHGAYKVTYITGTGARISNTVTDMTIIDATKNVDFPKRKDLENLKRLVKGLPVK